MTINGQSKKEQIKNLQHKVDSLLIIVNSLTIDSDNDGISNFYDKEKNTPKEAWVDGAGIAFDTDLDGIIDLYDRCVTLPGPIDYNGCPENSLMDQDMYKEIANKIEFEYYESNLTPVSERILDNYASAVEKYAKDLKFYVVSYSRDYESRLRNEEIAKKRAKKVTDYLMQKSLIFKNNFERIEIISSSISAPLVNLEVDEIPNNFVKIIVEK